MDRKCIGYEKEGKGHACDPNLRGAELSILLRQTHQSLTKRDLSPICGTGPIYRAR